MKLFVAGGTGFVGEHLLSELLAEGHSIRLLCHHRRPDVKESVEYWEGDVTNRDDLCEGVKGCDAVVNLVGIIREFPSRGITFERLHVQATANLVAAAEKNGIMRYLQMSALGTRPNAISAYHSTKFKAEEIVRGSALQWTIFRPSLIYGRHDAFVTMLARQIALFPIIPVIGDGLYRLQPIYVGDVARSFSRALKLPETSCKCYELCGGDRMTYKELLDAIAAALGKKPPIKLHLPLGLMQIIIPILQKVPQFPITQDQLQMLLEENISDDTSWKHQFDISPHEFKSSISEYLPA